MVFHQEISHRCNHPGSRKTDRQHYRLAPWVKNVGAVEALEVTGSVVPAFIAEVAGATG
jgi:hypothetical protein